MDKQNVVLPHNGIVFSQKKEGGTDPLYNLNENMKPSEEKLDTKGHILCDSFYVKYPE